MNQSNAMMPLNLESRGVLPTFEQLSTPHTIPVSLDGSNGTNRAPAERCKINAHHDYAALQCWLQQYADTATTHRLYQKEAERLLLWCLFQRQTALSSLTQSDMEQYLLFLDNPQPRELWCAKSGGKGKKRGMPGWKPFVGGLSQSAKKTAFAVLDSLFSFLFKARYLDFNPLELIRRRFKHFQSKEERRRAVRTKVLPPPIWESLIETLESLPAENSAQQDDKERLRWLVYLLYFLGLRNSDLSEHTFGAFEYIDEQWWFAAYGKGNKFGLIPVNDELLDAMRRFRTRYYRLPELPEPYEETPLIPSWRGEHGLSPRHVNNLLKALSTKTAERFTHQPEIAEKLRRFSAHWLRHQSATMQSYLGVLKKHAKENMRHSSEETMDWYDHSFEQTRHADTQKLTIRFPQHTVSKEREEIDEEVA